jgi:hypothetical protein
MTETPQQPSMLQKGLRRFEQTLMHETCGPHTPSVRPTPQLPAQSAVCGRSAEMANRIF